MEQKQEKQAAQVAAQIMQPIVKATDSKEFLMSTIGQQVKKFELTQRMAQVYTQSTIVPETYRGQQNIGNVMIALDMAERMRLNPLQVMQNLYVVYGNPSWSSKFLIAMFNQCGRYSSISYEERGKRFTDDFGVRAYAYEVSDKDRQNPIYGPWVKMETVKAEGWLSKNGSKWKTMPELMFRYRSAAQLINTVAPELSMGLQTAEEAEDAQYAEYEDVTPLAPRRATFDDLTPQNAAEAPQAAPQTAADNKADKTAETAVKPATAAETANNKAKTLFA